MFANERKLWRKPQIHEERITVVENKKVFLLILYKSLNHKYKNESYPSIFFIG